MVHRFLWIITVPWNVYNKKNKEKEKKKKQHNLAGQFETLLIQGQNQDGFKKK
jgi:hypothetical protein